MFQRANCFVFLLILALGICMPAFSQQGTEKIKDIWQLDESFGFPVWVVENKLIGAPEDGTRRIYLFIHEQNFSEQNIRKVFTGLAARYKTSKTVLFYAYSDKHRIESVLNSYGFISGEFEDSLRGKRGSRNHKVLRNNFRSGCYRAWYMRTSNSEEIKYSPDPEREYIRKIDLKHPQATYSGDAQKDLFTAIEQEDLEKIALLIETGIDVNQANSDGYTSLMKAAANGNTEMVQLLLSKDANVNLCNKRGANALMLASIDGATSVVELLLDKGADIDVPSNIDGLGDTALMAAALRGHRKTVQALIARGAKVDARNRLSETALMQAVTGANLDTVLLLIVCGADVNACTVDRWTSLMFAYLKPDMTKALLDAGADFTIVSKDGWTALMLATRYHQEKTMQVLVEGGAGKESIKACRAWIAAPPEDSGNDPVYLKDLGYRLLAEIYLKLGRKKEAIETSQQAIIDLGDKAHLRFRLGATYLATGDKKGAVEQYRILQKRLTRAVTDDAKRLYYGWTDALFKMLQ
jgi:uncharacterized protein